MALARRLSKFAVGIEIFRDGGIWREKPDEGFQNKAKEWQTV
jgi:hypothetical protein